VLPSVGNVEARIYDGRNGNSFANLNAYAYLDPNNGAMLKTSFFLNFLAHVI